MGFDNRDNAIKSKGCYTQTE